MVYLPTKSGNRPFVSLPARFMGKIVNVSRFRRDTVKYASRETDEWKPGIKTFLRFLKKISVEIDLENFQDLIVALDAWFWLHRAIWISLALLGDYRRSDFSRFQRRFLRFPLLRRFYVLFGAEFMSIFFVLEWKRPVVHSWICLNEKNSSLAVFDGLYYQAGARTKSGGRNLASSLITILFSPTSLYYFANSACF